MLSVEEDAYVSNMASDLVVIQVSPYFSVFSFPASTSVHSYLSPGVSGDLCLGLLRVRQVCQLNPDPASVLRLSPDGHHAHLRAGDLFDVRQKERKSLRLPIVHPKLRLLSVPRDWRRKLAR